MEREVRALGPDVDKDVLMLPSDDILADYELIIDKQIAANGRYAALAGTTIVKSQEVLDEMTRRFRRRGYTVNVDESAGTYEFVAA